MLRPTRGPVSAATAVDRLPPSRLLLRVLGRLGRSWGCPAVRSEIAHKLIDTIRGGSAIFAYYPEKSWLENSLFLTHDAQPRASALSASR